MNLISDGVLRFISDKTKGATRFHIVSLFDSKQILRPTSETNVIKEHKVASEFEMGGSVRNEKVTSLQVIDNIIL